MGVMPSRFLAISDLPPGTTREEVRATLERVAYEARHGGLRPVETFYSLSLGRTYTLLEAGSEESVWALFHRARFPAVEVIRGDSIFTDLLHEPLRAR